MEDFGYTYLFNFNRCSHRLFLAIPRDGSRSPARTVGKCLGFFLQCNADAPADQDNNNWSCMANAQLRVCPQREGIEPNVRKISHTFHSKENDWGYSQFIQCETLLDENNGFIKVIVVVLVSVLFLRYFRTILFDLKSMSRPMHLMVFSKYIFISNNRYNNHL